jgi:hypothetical protein
VTRAAAARLSDIDRALKAAAAAGLSVRGIEIEPHKVRILFGEVAESDKPPQAAPKEWPTGG